MPIRALRLAVPAALLIAATPARAQVDRRIAEEPTGGVWLPATPLAGEHDARATSVNPAGLHFVAAPELILALGLGDDDEARAAGPGFGAFLAAPLGGGLLPRIGFGVGFEWLRPARTRLVPDPGTPLRWTIATSLALGSSAALGVSWHQFYDDEAPGTLDGLATWDLGLSWRLGNRAALGAVVRDLGAPRLGTVPIQRRYELEMTGRPLGTDRLDLGLGGRIGETRGDVDAWLRGSVRVGRGLYAHAAVETRALHLLETTPTGERSREARDLVATVGFEVSFGGTGLTAYGAGGLDEDGRAGAVGGTLIARLSARHVPSALGRPDRIERVELEGAIGARAATRLVTRLRAIARDPAVRAVVVQLDGMTAGWATVQELRDELLAVRAAGKKVFAYLVVASGREYFLASAADKIYLDPAGGLRMAGLAGTTLYFRGLFDKLGVSAEFERIAEYKSAPESYTDIAPSAPALRMRDELYDSLFAELVAGIARGRGLDRDAAEALVRGGPYSAGDLEKDKRLVDAVAEPKQVAELIAVELGGMYPVSGPPDERDDRWERPAIAVIYADGDIVDGKSQTIPILGRRLVGSETIVAALQAARRDPSVKAVVIRIDSPGGSALASEMMSREVFALRGVKPVICSMGNVAASGGYYLAAGCDKIFAQPMTLTGSIGIFYGKFDLSGLLAKLGIAAVTVTRGDHADMDSFYRPYTEEERAIVQRQIRYLYGRFIGAVAKGRSMTEQQVDDVGRGRVWTGAQARGVGLVDELGGLGAAIDHAKVAAGMSVDDRVRIVELPRPQTSLLDTLLGGVAAARGGAAEDRLDAAQLALVREALRGLPASLLVAPDAPQARLPFELTWE